MEDENPGHNGILLDKYIHIEQGENKPYIPLGPPLTQPVSQKLQVFNEGDFFRVQLSPKMKENLRASEIPLFDGNEELVTYQKYTKNSGKKFNPHLWPREERKSMNTFLYPAAKSEQSIYYLTGCKLKYFWQTSDILREENVVENGIFTYPVLVLLAFMRLRHGFPFQILSILFDYTSTQILCDRFWQTVIVYFSRCNAVPKMFSDASVSEDEINDYLEDLTSEYDHLYKRIASRVRDPLNQGRKCYILNIDSKKWQCQKSSDKQFTKSCFSFHNKYNAMYVFHF